MNTTPAALSEPIFDRETTRLIGADPASEIAPDNKRVIERVARGMSETALTTTQEQLPGELRERMARQIRGARAEATWRAYEADWRVWEAWAAKNGASALPALPETVAAFLSDASAMRKLSTLRRYLASISVAHTLKGLAFQRAAPAIRTLMKGIAREKGGDRRRVRPLMASQALAMLADLGLRVVDARDAALLVLGIAMAGRRSELANLDWLERGSGNGVLELTEHGAVVRLFTSKTAQARTVEIHIQPGPALKAVKDWAERAGIAAGSPLFRAVSRSGCISPDRLTGGSVARIVKRRCAAAGLDPEAYSGHSLRAGMITTAAERGIPEWRIRMTSRHSEKGTELKGYIRPIEERKHALTNEIGL